jgi:hypothetical protein
MAESGQADVTFGMDPTSLQRLRSRDGVESSRRPSRARSCSRPTPPTRCSATCGSRALSLALDREAMARRVLARPETGGDAAVPAEPAAVALRRPRAARARPGAGRSLLAEAGFEPGPDGRLLRDGEPLVLVLRDLPRPRRAAGPGDRRAGRPRGRRHRRQVAVGNSSEIPAGHEGRQPRAGPVRAQLLPRPRPPRHAARGLRRRRRRVRRHGLDEPDRDRRAAGPRRRRRRARGRDAPARHRRRPARRAPGHPGRVVPAERRGEATASRASSSTRWSGPSGSRT